MVFERFRKRIRESVSSEAVERDKQKALSEISRAKAALKAAGQKIKEHVKTAKERARSSPNELAEAASRGFSASVGSAMYRTRQKNKNRQKNKKNRSSGFRSGFSKPTYSFDQLGGSDIVDAEPFFDVVGTVPDVDVMGDRPRKKRKGDFDIIGF